LVKGQATQVLQTARFDAIAREFLQSRQEEIYVTRADGGYAGAISLHDIKPYLNDAAVAAHVIAGDLLRDDVPAVAATASLAEALRVFAQHEGRTLPVVEPGGGRLAGILVKNDLLLALLEGRGAEKRGG
jgi:CIC family chloride channel protein